MSAVFDERSKTESGKGVWEWVSQRLVWRGRLFPRRLSVSLGPGQSPQLLWQRRWVITPRTFLCFAPGCDWLQFRLGSENLTSQLSGTAFPGMGSTPPLEIKGDRCEIVFHTDGSTVVRLPAARCGMDGCGRATWISPERPAWFRRCVLCVDGQVMCVDMSCVLTVLGLQDHVHRHHAKGRSVEGETGFCWPCCWCTILPRGVGDDCCVLPSRSSCSRLSVCFRQAADCLCAVVRLQTVFWSLQAATVCL